MNAALDVDEPGDVEHNIQAPAPLRRPHSPQTREPMRADREDSGSDKGSKKFTPPGHHSMMKSGAGGQRNNQGSGGRNFNNRQNDSQFDKSERFDKADNQGRPSRQPEKSYRQGPDGGKPLPRRPQVATDDDDNRGHRSGHESQQSGYSYRDRKQGQGRVSFADRSRDDEDWDDGSVKRQPQPQYRQKGISSGITFQETRRFRNRGVEQRSRGHHSSQTSKADNTSTPERKPTPVKQEATSQPVTPNAKPVRANRVGATPAPTNRRSPTTKQNDPPANQMGEKISATNEKPPGNATDVTPTRKLVPKNCLLDLLGSGDSLLVSVESTEEASHSPGRGFVCLVLSEKHAADYSALCDDYGAACEQDQASHTPVPGETFSICNPDDSSWYRARCLSKSHCALLDTGKVLPLGDAQCRRLPTAYGQQPEFSAVLQANVELGATLKCEMREKTGNGWTVQLFDTTGEQSLGRGEMSRWLPTVQYPPATITAPVAIPEVARPPVVGGSAVWLVHVTDRSHVFVRASDANAQRAFDAALHDAALHGLSAKPLSTPPAMGAYVISKYTDGLHYRALVKRTNVKQNKYLLEYVEFGNCHVNQLENLYPCPENLLPSAAKPMTSRVALRGVTSQHPLTAPAEKYLDTLKDDSVELLLTIPDGPDPAPAGSEVELIVAATKESVNKRVEEMCTPEWVQIQRRGGDVLETETIMYSELQFLDLPPGPGELIVLDYSALAGGTLSACRDDSPQLFKALDALTERMAKYCESELGREPYLPKVEELCIAQMPPYQQWFRAVLAEQVSGPGGVEAEVCYIDYGNMERVPVALLRKMLPEFARELPALASTVEVKDFPSAPTHAMLERAVQHLRIDDEGRGRLSVAACEKTGPGLYNVAAPKLLAAMAGHT